MTTEKSCLAAEPHLGPNEAFRTASNVVSCPPKRRCTSARHLMTLSLAARSLSVERQKQTIAELLSLAFPAQSSQEQHLSTSS